MTGYNSWTADIAAAVVGCISMPTGAITTVAGWIQKANYNRNVNRLFIQGGKDGNGLCNACL